MAGQELPARQVVGFLAVGIATIAALAWFQHGDGCDSGKRARQAAASEAPAAGPPVRFDRVPADRRADIERAAEVFRAECGPFFGRHAPDVAEIVVRHDEHDWLRRDDGELFRDDAGAKVAFNYKLEEYGWRESVHIEVRLLDRVETLDEYAGGHVLHYWLGGGATPGIEASAKKWGARPCRLTRAGAAGDGYFRRVDALAFLR